MNRYWAILPCFGKGHITSSSLWKYQAR